MRQSTDDTESKESTRKGFRFWGGKRKERKDGKLSSSVAKVAPPASKVTDSIASHTPSPRSIPISSAVTAPSKGILKKELAEDAAAKPVSTLGKSEQEAHGKHKLPRTWLYRSKRFRKWCEWAFNVIDTDNSNKVTETELYSGLLLIHLKLGTYAGPAACRPLSRERCHAMFQKMDLDGSGFLEFDEFQQAMSVLFGNILLRVIAQWSLTIMIVPLISQKVLEGIYWMIAYAYDFITSLDEYTTWDETAALTLEEGAAWTVRHLPSPVWEACTKIINYCHYPAPLLKYYDTIGDAFGMIPESVWNTIPLTLLSTVLGILVIPWFIFEIDDLFSYFASRQRANIDM